MSLIPPDESRGDGRRTPKPADSERSPAARFSVLATSLVVTIAAAIERLLTGYNRRAVSGAESESSDLPEPVSEGGLASYDRSRDRAVGAEIELVATETGDELTVKEAGNPDTAITSDTWVAVER